MTVQKISTQNSDTSGVVKAVKKKPAPPTSGRWLWFGFGIASVAMLSATAGAFLAVSLSSTPLMQSQLSPDEEAVFGGQGDRISRTGLGLTQLTRPVNILVLGMSVLPPDTKTTPTKGQNLRYLPQVNSFDGFSDTMLLLRFNPETKKLVMLSIPRDTRVAIEGRGFKKINATNVIGGPALSAKATSELLNGVPIDRYVRINVLGVGKLVDALGGVTVYVPKDMKYQDDSQHLYVNLKAGKHHLNGDQTLQLLRFRHDALGDIGRIQRQQMVIRALVEQTLNPTTLARLPQILAAVQSNIDTNLNVEELMALVGFGVQTNRSNIQMLMLPGRFSGTGREYESSYWLPNSDRIASLMAQHFDVPTAGLPAGVESAALRVAIQDSTGNEQAVQSLTKTLQTAGYRNIFVSKPWSEPLAVTHIIAQQGDTDSAQVIRQALNLGEVRVESTGNIDSDITIQLGRDWLEKNSQL